MRRLKGKWVSENEYNILQVTQNDLYIECLNNGFHSMEEREILWNSDNDYDYDNMTNSYGFQGFIYESDVMVIAKTEKTIWFVINDNEDQFTLTKNSFSIHTDYMNATNNIIEEYFNNEDIIFQDSNYLNGLVESIIDEEYFGIIYEDSMSEEVQISKFYKI